jgi:hypothetical protein
MSTTTRAPLVSFFSAEEGEAMNQDPALRALEAPPPPAGARRRSRSRSRRGRLQRTRTRRVRPPPPERNYTDRDRRKIWSHNQKVGEFRDGVHELLRDYSDDDLDRALELQDRREVRRIANRVYRRIDALGDISAECQVKYAELGAMGLLGDGNVFTDHEAWEKARRKLSRFSEEWQPILRRRSRREN